MPKLTKARVDALPLPASGQKTYWDSELRGFGVRVLPSGLKTFVLQYRNADGRSRKLALARHGVLTPEQARVEARARLGEIARGNDPIEARDAARAAPTVADICDWYLEEAESGRLLGRRRLPIKMSTLRMDRSRIERHINPLIGKRKVRSLSPPDIAAFQADVAQGTRMSFRQIGPVPGTSKYPILSRGSVMRLRLRALPRMCSATRLPVSRASWVIPS